MTFTVSASPLALRLVSLALLASGAFALGSPWLPNSEAASTARAPFRGQVSEWREGTVPADDRRPKPLSLTITDAFPDREWWRSFQDPQLEGYLQEALTANPTLLQIEARVREARAQVRITRAQELPQLAIGGNFSRVRNSQTIIPNAANFGGSGNTSQNSGGGGGLGGFVLGQYLNFYSLPLSAAYEPDLFLKNRDLTRAQARNAEAATQELATARLVLAAELAGAYFNLLAADQRLSLAEARYTLAASAVTYATARFQEGVASQEAVALAESQRADALLALDATRQLQALALNQVALLLGRTTDQVKKLPRASLASVTLPEAIPAGIPSELLRRRPDLLAAEARLEAARLQARAAKKDLFPSFTLTGQFGFATANLKDWLQWDSYITSLGVGAAQSIFAGGAKRGALAAARARYDQAFHGYQDAVLRAFKEVDDSLASLKAHHGIVADAQASLDAARSRQAVVGNRVAAGALAVADAVPAELSVLNAQDVLTQARLTALLDTLSLYRATAGQPQAAAQQSSR